MCSCSEASGTAPHSLMPKTHCDDGKSSRETDSVPTDGYRDMHAQKKKKGEETDEKDVGLPLGWEGTEIVE